MNVYIWASGELKNAYIGEFPNYTVNWKNYDNTILETDLKVPEWTTPTYNSATPTRTGYDFTWWSPTPAPIYADTDYTAQFVQSEVTTTYNFKTWQQWWYWAGSETSRWDSDYLSGKWFYWFNTSSKYCWFWYGCPSTISWTIKEVTQKFYVPYSWMWCWIAVSNTWASIHVRTDWIYVRKNNSAGFSKHTSLSLSVWAHTVKYDFTHSWAIYVYIDSWTTPYIINDWTATDEKYNNLFKTGWTNKTFRMYVYSLPNRGDTYNYAYIESLVTKTQ